METKFQKVKNIIFTPIENPNDKHWVLVTFENNTKWMPSFIDLGKIISMIGKCEDIKYPKGEGYKYAQRFFNECFNKTPKQIEELYRTNFDPNNLLK